MRSSTDEETRKPAVRASRKQIRVNFSKAYHASASRKSGHPYAHSSHLDPDALFIWSHNECKFQSLHEEGNPVRAVKCARVVPA